jgi:uncharacterized protein (DUF1684 family)
VTVLLALALAQQMTAAALAAGDPAAYTRDVEGWRRGREERLTADGGWLTVVGLAWLSPGRNTFGAAAGNSVLLPAHSSPRRGGAFVVEGDRVTIEVAPGVEVTRAGKPVTRAQLRTDAGGADPDVLALGAVTMQVLARGDRLAVRIKDRRSAARATFKGLRWYPVKPEYRVTARFRPHETPTTIRVDSVVGIAEPMVSPGTVEFEIGGKTVHLDPVLEPGERQLFFIFRDATTGRTTYGGGRFLHADPPRDGVVVLDFNRAYTPPCGFTAFATCPLPPAQNRLPVAIEAGELTPSH